MLLCLLAVLFAVEAKLAWFGPDGSPTAQISASKLQPADSPKIAAHSHASSLPGGLLLQFAAILVVALMGRGAIRLPWRVSATTIPGSPSFFPSLFFRPPPSC
jgi:hypothetical protein